MGKDDRFFESYSQGGFVSPAVKILVDKQTGANYMFAQSGYSGGLTPLLNRDGTSMITPVPNKYDQ